jgi:hypothetical protein
MRGDGDVGGRGGGRQVDGRLEEALGRGGRDAAPHSAAVAYADAWRILAVIGINNTMRVKEGRALVAQAGSISYPLCNHLVQGLLVAQVAGGEGRGEGLGAGAHASPRWGDGGARGEVGGTHVGGGRRHLLGLEDGVRGLCLTFGGPSLLQGVGTIAQLAVLCFGFAGILC